MERHNQVPMCDITTFVRGLLEEKEQCQEKMSRRSTRIIGKRVNYNFEVIKNSKEDDIKEATNMSENEGSDSQDNYHKRKLRERFKDDVKEEIDSESDDSEDKPVKTKLRKGARKEMYDFAYDDQSEEESETRKPKDKFSRVEDSDDEDYDPFKTKLRKGVRKEKYVFAYADDQSEEESQTRKPKDKFSRVEDSDNEDYDPFKVSDDDSWDSGQKTKKSKEREKPKTKRILTEYEKMVEKNRAEKMALLKSLKFDEVKKSLSDAVKSLKKKHKRKKRKRVLLPKPSGPLHMTLRVLQSHSGSVHKSLQVKHVELPRIKKLPQVLPFEKAMHEAYSYEYFRKEYGDLDHRHTQPFNDHVSHFEAMQLPESLIAKVASSKIMSMSFHPMKENILLAAGAVFGKIEFWKVNSGQDSFVFVPHSLSVTQLQFNPKQPQFIVSSSNDGTLRCGDLEKAVFMEVYNASEETGCTFFDFLSHSTFLVAQSNGIVSVVDQREELIRAACKKHQCDPKRRPIRSVSVHPVDNSYFVTAGIEGSVKLWDLRKLQKQPIVVVQHNKKNVQSAYFSPLTGKHVLTTSSDDSICLFDSSKLGKSLLRQHSMQHDNQTKGLTAFRSTWLPNTDSAFVVGSMLDPGRIEVYDDKMNNIFNFTHENLDCTTSVNIFHPSLPVLAGANSSGKVYVFTNEDVS